MMAIVNRVHDLEAYITVQDGTATYLPRDGDPVWENFPTAELAEHYGRTRTSLGAEEGWREDPYGEPRERRHVTFTAEGPDAEEAIAVIEEVVSSPPPASMVGTLGSHFASSIEWVQKVLARGLTKPHYRPPGHRLRKKRAPEKATSPTAPWQGASWKGTKW